MEQLKGYDIPFELKQMRLRANLIMQDGPLLSLYYNDKGDYYLFYWLDCDEKVNRWMVMRVDMKSLCQYLNKERTLLQLIQKPSDSFVWIVDIDGHGRQIRSEALPFNLIPSDYLPCEDSWFEFDNRQELLNDVSMDSYEIDVPKSEKSLFSALMAKMGWQLSPKTLHQFIDKVAF